MSRWMCVKRQPGMAMGSTPMAGCLVTLALAQDWQSLHQAVMSADMPRHATREAISRRLALPPRCARPWSVLNTCRLAATGIRGRMDPLDTSHRISWLPRVTTLRCGEPLDAACCVS
jgi:hypothetical protein